MGLFFLLPAVHVYFVFDLMFGKLYNLYWYIRYYSRNKTKKRKYYRYVAKVKKRLIESGADTEEVRLLCRMLSNRRNMHAERRLERYRKNRFLST